MPHAEIACLHTSSCAAPQGPTGVGLVAPLWRSKPYKGSCTAVLPSSCTCTLQQHGQCQPAAPNPTARYVPATHWHQAPSGCPQHADDMLGHWLHVQRCCSVHKHSTECSPLTTGRSRWSQCATRQIGVQPLNSTLRCCSHTRCINTHVAAWPRQLQHRAASIMYICQKQDCTSGVRGEKSMAGPRSQQAGSPLFTTHMAGSNTWSPGCVVHEITTPTALAWVTDGHHAGSCGLFSGDAPAATHCSPQPQGCCTWHCSCQW